MSTSNTTYLGWSKTHALARYELTRSGIAPVSVEEASLGAEDWSLLVEGAYGHPELVELIAGRYGVDAGEVLPVTGTSAANFVALSCAARPGERIAVESPAYEPLIRAGEFQGLGVGRFRRDPARRYAPDLEDVARELKLGARAVVMSDLHNPSGCECPPGILDELSKLCASYSAWLIVDEVYRDMVSIHRGESPGTAATLGPHVVTTNSLTKAYGFGGLRVGWLIADRSFVARAGLVFDHLSVDLPAPSTSAGIRILRRIEAFAARTRAIHRHSCRIFCQWLSSRQDLRSYGNDGAVFAYVRLPEGVDADGFCEVLRRRYHTGVVSGAYFGDPDHVRVGFGLPEDELVEGLRRFGAALDEVEDLRG